MCVENKVSTEAKTLSIRMKGMATSVNFATIVIFTTLTLVVELKFIFIFSLF